MAKSKLTHEAYTDNITELVKEMNEVIGDGSDYFSKGSNEEIGRLLKERRGQRKTILRFILWLTGLAFGFLCFVVIWQSILRIIGYEGITLLDGYELEILSVAVFGQAITVICIITKSLWSDKDYLDLFKSDKKDK